MVMTVKISPATANDSVCFMATFRSSEKYRKFPKLEQEKFPLPTR